MAGFHTYESESGATRQAEDVQDMVYIVSPIDSPIASMSKTVKATGKYHEWSEDELRAATSLAAVEGAVAPADVSQAMVEKGNYCQIQTLAAVITGTLEDVKKYARTSEMSYQLELRYGELANSEEFAISGSTLQAASAGDTSTARRMGCLQSQVDASVTVDATATATVAGLEANVIAAHQATYQEGGNPDYMIVSPATSLYIADFAYTAGKNRQISNGREDRTVVNAVELYISPFGELDVILSRHLDPASILLLDFEYLATPVLRPTSDWPLSKDGDYESRQILRESTFAVLNSKAHAYVSNVQTGLTPPA